MKIAFISTGTELLKGSAVNTNLAYLGQKLTEIGLTLTTECAAGDQPGAIAGALSYALKTADVIILCGGLGPTSDDMTLDVVARFFGLELHQAPELVDKVTASWQRRHTSHCPKNQYRQARLPESGVTMDNPYGSANGVAVPVTYAGVPRQIFLLPGPPHEFTTMVDQQLLPRLRNLAPSDTYTCGCLVANVGESQVARLVEKPLLERGVAVAYCAQPGGTRLFVTASNLEQAQDSLEFARELLGPAALPNGVLALPNFLAALLQQRQLTMSCAESCTGGLVSDAMVQLPGVSEVFYGGVVAYDNSVKQNVLHVPAAILEQFGAVSEECVEKMVQGVQNLLHTDCAVATTGIAGPGGGTSEKPVGTVWIAARCRAQQRTELLHLRGSRAAIRARAVALALWLLIQMLQADHA